MTAMTDDARRQILLEIALSISGELDIKALLSNCLPLFLRKLNCTAAAVVQVEQEGITTCMALPLALARTEKWSGIVAHLSHSVACSDTVARYNHGQDLFFGFCLPDFGLLILGRPREFDPVFLKEFTPLAGMLARACRACQEADRRRRAEQRLGDAMARQEALLDNLPFMAWMKSPEGRYTAVNKAFADHFGLRVDQVIGKATHDIWPADKARMFAANDAEALASGKTVQGRDEEVAADGVHRWFEFSKRPIVHPQGTIGGSTGFRWEITDRVRAEQALKYQAGFQKVVMDLAIGFVNTPLHELDQGINNALAMIGAFAQVDRAYLFRYDFDRDVMNNTHEWCAQGTAPQVDQLQDIPNSLVPSWVAAHRKGETLLIADVSALSDTDPLRQLLEPQGIQTLITLPLTQGDSCFGFVGFDLVRTTKQWSNEEIALLKVLTELFTNAEVRREHENHLIKAKAQAEAASLAKSEFLANMSHEIRTPLHGVVSMIGLAKETDLTPEQREFMNMAETSAESLLSVINDILDFSKIEAGKLELTPRLFNLETEVLRLASLMSAKAREKDLELQVRYDLEAPRMVEADNLRLRQILTNLLANAVKFTEQGHVLLNVQCLGTAPNETRLRFTVEDTGIGIPESRLADIFDQFTQVDGSSSRMYGGTGLGLAIARQLVIRMGGDLEVGSVLGRGSSFSFELTLPWQDSAEPDSARDLQGRRALVVDDMAVNRRVFAEYLSAWGVTHDSAATAAAALELLEAEATAGRMYDFILLDHAMPETNGLDLAQRIKQEPGWRETKLILLTSMWGMVGKDQCRACGICAALPKPVAASDLFNAIFDCLRGGQATKIESETRAEEGMSSQTGPTIPAGEQPTLNVLLVDDHPINRKSAHMVLKKMHCVVATAENGLDALELVQTQDFDLVFMDVQMPIMDGYEATQAIRELGGKFARLPIIALTANAMEGDRERCLAAGMNDYLPKPMPRQDLLTMLEKYRHPVPGDSAENEPLLDDVPIFNVETLLTNYDQDVEMAREMARDFLDQTSGDLAALEQVLHAREPSRAGKEAHRLKGPCAYVGAERMGELAAMIERSLRDEQWEQSLVLYAELQRVWRVFGKAVSDWLEG